MKLEPLFYDIEVFKRMNMVGFMKHDKKGYVIVNAPNLESSKHEVLGVVIYINVPETRDRATKYLSNETHTLFGFNNHGYDDFLIKDILTNRPTEYIKLKSDTIVKKENSFKLTIKGKEKLIVYISNIENIELGDKVVVKGKYTLPKKATIPNNFDYQKYLYNNHIFYIMYAKELKIIKKNQNITFKIKKYILDKTSNYTNNGYLNAFIIGDKTDLEFYKTYQNNGISHLFALSGMHISMLSLIIYKLVNKFKHKDLIVIMFLLFYITLTNFSASILRTIIFLLFLN